jgi:hypothetical protein
MISLSNLRLKAVESFESVSDYKKNNKTNLIFFFNSFAYC